ncbi:MAG: hypothetical protein EBU33_10260, partial [Sphingobacteriia bacterium]|nr:hypothetical protein [Sphingobacteriia bacterium]
VAAAVPDFQETGIEPGRQRHKLTVQLSRPRLSLISSSGFRVTKGDMRWVFKLGDDRPSE